MLLITRIQAFMAVAVFAAVLGCNSTGHFVPGESPTVTPVYNAEGTPSAPIVITEDLPAAWQWQYSREFPVKARTLGCCLALNRRSWASSSMKVAIAGS